MEPGLYFGLPDDEYHAIEALSNTGIKRILVSPLDFWARSWMNPTPEEDEETVFKVTGKAYHTRIVEGRPAFDARYAAELDPAAHPNALRTVDQIKEALRAHGETVTGAKPVLVERLLGTNSMAEVWDVLAAAHAKANEGKILLPAELIQKIEISTAMIEKHPQLAKCFTGGGPEVSVFWTAEGGIPMKVRIDYLKPRAIVDLKTFSNPLAKPVDRAIANAMAQRKYHIQVAVYQEGAERAREFAQEGRIFGEVDPEWVERFTAAEDFEFVFVFQQTGIAPVARGKVMPKGLVYDCGVISMNEAIATFLECREKFGTDPWIDDTPIGAFDDSEFPVYMTE